MSKDTNEFDTDKIKAEEMEVQNAENEESNHDELELEEGERNNISSLEEMIERLNNENAELKDKMLRIAAEGENSKKRLENEVLNTRKYAIDKFSKDIISVMDNLLRALNYTPEDMSEDFKNFVAGVEMTKAELENIFNKHGIKIIEPAKGDSFDYNLHNAISQIATADQDAGTILEVMSVGYILQDRLLRPANVVVAKAAE